MPRRRRSGALAGAALLIALSPGCRTLGAGAHGAYATTNAWFMRNPVAQIPYLVGLGLGFVAGLPLTLISWPLSAIFYPSEDGDEFFLSASTCPSLSLGALVGTLLGAPFYPFGLPFVPDEADEPAPPAAEQGR